MSGRTPPGPLRIAIIVGLSASVAACSVGGEYARQDLHRAHGEQWRTQPVDPPTTSLVGTAPVAAWWGRFGDAELERLAAELVEENLVLAEARERIVEARARRGVTNADRLPQVDLAAQYLYAGTGDQGLSFQGPPPGTQQELYAAGALAGWEVDLWGRVAKLIQAADRDIEAEVEAYRDAAVSLVAEIALAYIDVRALQTRIALLDRSVGLLERSLDLTESRYSAGTGTELDVSRARRLLDATRASRPDLRRALAVATNGIAVLLGRPPADGLVGPGALPEPPEAIGIGLPAQLLTRRADVRSAERRYAASIARVGVAVGDRYPKLRLFGSINLQTGTAADLYDPDALVYSFGPSLTFPLFDGGRIESNIRVQESRAEQARLVLERTLLEAVGEVENAAAGVIQMQERVVALDRAVGEARRSVDLADHLYRSGTRDLFQLLDAQRELIAVEADVTTAKRDALAEIVRLYRALGGGWPELGGDAGDNAPDPAPENAERGGPKP